MKHWEIEKKKKKKACVDRMKKEKSEEIEKRIGEAYLMGMKKR